MQIQIRVSRKLIPMLMTGILLLTQCGAGTSQEERALDGASGSEATMPTELKDHGRPSIPSPEEITKLPSDGGEHWNRLIFEKSPYLLQHAGNPVDWYPWGPEAFEKAKAEDKPIFLSIGYSTCHWCHVMEHESFVNEEIAAILNEHYVAIKVDREERPDIDNVYMTAVQAMTRGRGGWPLSAFLTAEGRPFFGGTYFPPEDRYGRPGFRSLLTNLSDAWKNQRAEIMQNTDQLVEILKRSNQSRGGADIGEATLQAGAGAFAARFDSLHGGFGEQPKFPTSHNLSFLLRHWYKTKDAHTLAMVERTLEKMALGGMYDQLGGGFHRYSTDRQWLVPHFEKMLYDQAMLSRTYLEAFQVTGNERYAEVARGIFTYVLRDMTDPDGGFYSAEDADSEGEEGTFYVWRPQQVIEILGADSGKRFNETYGVTESGNFEKRTSILHLKQPLEAIAVSRGLDPEPFRDEMAEARERLRVEREKRIPPLRDDKIITAWNGLMISSMAYGSQVLDEPVYREAAARAADFVLEKLKTEDGRLLRHYRKGAAAISGYINDYAFFTNALIDVYEATFDPRYLAEAITLAGKMETLFWDAEDGGFSFQGTDGEELLIRSKEVRDGAIPSGNSIAALALLRLGSLTADANYGRRADEILAAFSGDIAQVPSGHAQMLIALDYALGPTVEIVLAGEPEAKGMSKMLQALHRRFIPNKVVALQPGGKAGERIAALAPFLSEQEAIDGKVTAYVCRNHACSLPTSDPAEMVSLIEEDAGPR